MADITVDEWMLRKGQGLRGRHHSWPMDAHG